MSNWLIVYRRKRGELLRCEEYADSAEASAERFKLEREHPGDRDLEIVVLSADSLETVERTHRRYFLSAKEGNVE